MKLHNIIVVFFLGSLILFAPLARSGDEYRLTPGTEKTIVLNVQNSVISIEASNPTEIDITVSYMAIDRSEENNLTLISKEIFKSSTEIEVNQKGFYRLDFLSPENIVTITISTNTIPETSLIIVGVTFSLMLVFQLRKQFSRSFAY